MKFDFQNLTLKNKVLGIFILFSVSIFVNFMVIRYQKVKGSDFGNAIDIAGKNRMLSQRIALLATEIADGNELAREELASLVIEHDTAKSILLSGGKLPNGSKKLSKASKEGKEQIKLITKLWRPYMENAMFIVNNPLMVDSTIKKKVEIPPLDSAGSASFVLRDSVISIKNPSLLDAAFFLQQQSKKLLIKNDQLVKIMVKEGDQIQKRFDTIVFILTFINIGIFCIVYLVAKKTIFRPMDEISKITGKIAQRDFTSKINYKKKDEIGDIAFAIDQLIDNINNSASFVNHIGEGNLDVQYAGLNEGEELHENSLAGALIRMRDRMKKVAEEDVQRNWSNQGLTKFVDILRQNNDDIRLLGDQIISNLVKYTNSIQGGLFIINEDSGEKILEMIACYAYNQKKYLEKRIVVGEGIIGQTYKEKKTTHMVEVPAGYTNIRSGIGGSKPNSLIAVPLQINNEVYGIVELASFHTYQDYQIAFVEKLGENIASTLAGVQTSEKTKNLLEESQMLTEQMKAQEEEMRQNMEELSATQEEMARKEIEMTEQFYAINTAFATAEYNSEGTILTCNENYASAIGYATEELEGKSNLIIENRETETEQNYDKLWEQLKKGKAVSGDYPKVFKNGNTHWFHTTYCPIKDMSGQILKILEFAEEINSPKTEGRGNAPLPDEDEILRLHEVGEELKQNLAALDETNQVFSRRLDAINHAAAILETDNSGLVTFASLAFYDLTEASEESVLGNNYTDLIFQGLGDEDLQAIKDTLQNGAPVKTSCRLTNNRNKNIEANASITPIMDKNKKLTKLIIVLFENAII